MATFAPITVPTRHRSEIAQDRCGLWRARDEDGLIGGIFRTRKDALRFASFEAGGDSASVYVLPEDNS
jgi:hypothetical protein